MTAQAQNQIVETEHLFKALLEQPNGLARRILSKAGSNATDMLDKTDAYIRSQPRVSGDSAQVLTTTPSRSACRKWPFFSVGWMGAFRLHQEALDRAVRSCMCWRWVRCQHLLHML